MRCTCDHMAGQCPAHPLARQPREHPVPCRQCAAQTWNTGAVCDDCLDQAIDPRDGAA